ncbi:hypothetical protein, partial [Benzoatithermus flavus]
HAMRSILKASQSMEDIEKVGHLYHNIVLIEHLLDVMEFSMDENERFDAFSDLKQKTPLWLEQVSDFLRVGRTVKEVL